MNDFVNAVHDDGGGQDLVRKFRRAVNETYDTLTKMGFGDRGRFDELGAVALAHQCLKSATVSEGFSQLWEMGRLHLSIEALVLRPEFKDLFSADERRIAQERLSHKGYSEIN